MEIWKKIDGFDSLYKISNLGIVKSLGKGKSTNPYHNKENLIKTTYSKTGYEKIKLSKDGKRYFFHMHRLVALNFILNTENKREVNHINGNKSDNRACNLEWVTSSENQKHAFKLGLQTSKIGENNKQSKKVRQLTIDGVEVNVFESINDIKRKLGYNSFGIIKCCKKEKKYKTAYKYKWEYVSENDRN